MFHCRFSKKVGGDTKTTGDIYSQLTFCWQNRESAMAQRRSALQASQVRASTAACVTLMRLMYIMHTYYVYMRLIDAVIYASH